MVTFVVGRLRHREQVLLACGPAIVVTVLNCLDAGPTAGLQHTQSSTLGVPSWSVKPTE